MNNQYKYFGKTLTPNIAQELIKKLFAGQTIPRREIIKVVDETHRERGGEPSAARGHHPVALALSAMKKSGIVSNPGRGLWFILPQLKTLSSFVKWAEQFRYKNYVFRGVSNAAYKIEASAARGLEEKEEKEKTIKHLKINEELIENARVQGHGEKNGKSLSDLDLLAELQHHEAGTCLIDFTRNPLVALWMACRKGSSGKVDGKISVVDISNRLTFQPVDFDSSQEKKIGDFFQWNEHNPVDFDSSQEKKIGDFFQWNEHNEYQLYHWQPKYQNSRMLAQQSIFLFGGAEIEPATECIILESSKQDIRTSLANAAGITEMILFPDFEGFTRHYAQSREDIEPDAQDYLTRSIDAFRENMIDAAIDYCTRGISLQPQDNSLLVHLYVNRAIAYEAKGNYDSIIKNYSEVIRLDSNYMPAYINRGIAKLELGQYEEAIVDCNEAIRLKPDHAPAYNNRGNAKSGLGQYEEAIVDYDEAIRLKPDHAFFYYNRGIAKFELEQYEEAIVDYDEAIRLKPDYASAYNNRGNAKSELGRCNEAIEDYDEAIRLKPDRALAYYNRGTEKFELGGHLDGAERDFQMALQLAEKVGNANLVATIKAELDELKPLNAQGNSKKK